jgi:hypothetical protein
MIGADELPVPAQIDAARRAARRASAKRLLVTIPGG